MGFEQKQRSYRFGIAAEKLAGVYLTCKGYRVLAGRYRNRLGEIDLVAQKGNTLVAVEVKARKDLASCEEAVPPWKQQKIARAMEGLMSQGNFAGLGESRERNIRFDVIWVAPWRWPKHIKDAWRL